jgi:cytoskeletal protein CcmA (bactofilin family)
MSERKRRFLEGASSPSTFIGAESVILGDVRGRGQFVVAGEVHGDGDLAGSLTLASSGIWNGHVHAHEAMVAGKIAGSLIITGKLEIGFTAVIRGRVSAGSIAIAKGAIVDGEIEVTSGAPVHEFEERRRAPVAVDEIARDAVARHAAAPQLPAEAGPDEHAVDRMPPG